MGNKKKKGKFQSLGSKYLEKIHERSDISSGGVVDGFITGMFSQNTNFEEALRNADTATDPEKFMRATDGKDEKSTSKIFEPDLFKNMGIAKKKIEARRKSLTDDERKTDEEIRKNNIDHNAKILSDEMDKRRTDSLTFSNIKYQNVTILRIPDETSEIKATCNGKPVEVKRNLSGYEVSMDGDHPEISLDMIKRAAEEMGMEGKTHWSEDTMDGNSVDISMKAMYGKSPVYVDPELRGDEIRFIKDDENGTSRLMISQDSWEHAATKLVEGKGLVRSWEKTAGDGHSIRFTMSAKVNGYDAVPERRLGEDEIVFAKGKAFVGKNILKNAAETMNMERSTHAKIDLENGYRLDCKRSGKFKMYMNGKEIPDNVFDAALAEVSGLNMSNGFRMSAELGKNAADQMKIQSARTAVGGVIGAVTSIPRNAEQSVAFVGQILGEILQQLTRTQTITRG